jgi:hypothetical protein
MINTIKALLILPTAKATKTTRKDADADADADAGLNLGMGFDHYSLLAKVANLSIFVIIILNSWFRHGKQSLKGG